MHDSQKFKLLRALYKLDIAIFFRNIISNFVSLQPFYLSDFAALNIRIVKIQVIAEVICVCKLISDLVKNRGKLCNCYI